MDYVELAGIAVAMFGIWGATFRWFLSAIRRVEQDVKKGDDVLHARVNEVIRDTVHKGDLNELGNRLGKGIDDLREQQITASRDTNKRLDAILTATANRNMLSAKMDKEADK
ncbi:MAG: hypothetical protein FKY71_08670 [Spiribacter salinus]|uniref:Uncharacterized protein n=1 Tax=Spiribacter salinus TaxID=1335746 RepID=A0A540VRP5_9GAMM|nr:MAG: hypothetical protein FKY71_08670 [Spiribacter salinus]